MEIREASEIINGRTRNDAVKRGIVSSICGKIKTIKAFGLGQANELYNAVDTFDPEVKELLVAAIDARLGNGLSARGTSFTSYSHMRFMTHYLTTKDWDAIAAAKGDTISICSIIVQRMCRLGVRNASDSGLVKWVVAIACHASFQALSIWPSYRATYDLSKEVKAQLSSRKSSSTMQHIEHYPEFPQQLPEVAGSANRKPPNHSPPTF